MFDWILNMPPNSVNRTAQLTRKYQLKKSHDSITIRVLKNIASNIQYVCTIYPGRFKQEGDKTESL